MFVESAEEATALQSCKTTKGRDTGQGLSGTGHKEPRAGEQPASYEGHLVVIKWDFVLTVTVKASHPFLFHWFSRERQQGKFILIC